jgi:3,4-dihydroxy 2-butanone 4-phosphate synthase/GTP cyclohydrolase II
VERVPIEMPATRRNRPYLVAKRDKLGHLLKLEAAIAVPIRRSNGAGTTRAARAKGRKQR